MLGLTSLSSKPIIKWVGGKRQLISEIKRYMPKSYKRYFEPFIGGGALFFELSPKEAFINDYNAELTNLYNIVKNSPEELMDDLAKHINTSEYYYKIRALDRDEKSYNNLNPIQKASRFIYLNKTGFNGLYRVNKKNQCNVPYGNYKNPKYVDRKKLLSCSKLLSTTTITTGDFENIKEFIKKEDFIYLDPPYVPINETSSFTGYTHKGFDYGMQFRLKELCDYIDSIGAYFMLSNSYTKIVLYLYQDYEIKVVEAKRAINSKADGRGKVKEVLVLNY
jgi:DNA adenine methylase